MKTVSCFSAFVTLTTIGLLSLSSALHGQGFSRMAEELDIDGEFLAYIDLEGDASLLGQHFNAIYTAYLENNPEAMPIPLDFTAIFNQIGIGGIQSIGYSSIDLGDDLYRNRSVLLLDGEPQGLLQLYGLEPRSFRAAQLAPANATMAIEASLEFGALRETVSRIAASVMGPMGVGMVEGGLQQPLTSSGLTGNALIEYLSNPLTLILRLPENIHSQTEFLPEVYAEVAHARPLLEHLVALSESQPEITVREVEGNTIVDLSRVFTDERGSLFAKKSEDDDALILYSSAAFLAEIGTGDSLAESPEFQRVASKLPANAAGYSFQRGMPIDLYLDELRDNPATAAYLPVIEIAFDRLLGDFFAPQATAYYAIDGGIASVSYAGYSIKEALAVVPAFLVGGITAAAAIPAYQNVQATSQEKAVTNNLRQFASVAQQHMLVEGVTQVSYADLVGPGRYIEKLEPVAGESYEQLVVRASDTVISVKLGDGRVVSYEF